MYSTKTAHDLRDGVRHHLGDMLSDVRELTDDFGALRSDLANDWRYLRADLATDWSNLLYRARNDLDAWRNRRRQAPAALAPFPGPARPEATP